MRVVSITQMQPAAGGGGQTLPSHARLTTQMGGGGGAAGTLPCWMFIPLLKPKVTSWDRNDNLYTNPGHADSSSLFWRLVTLWSSPPVPPATHTVAPLPFSPVFSPFLDLNTECHTEGRKGSYLTPSSRTPAKYLAFQPPLLQNLKLGTGMNELGPA